MRGGERSRTEKEMRSPFEREGVKMEDIGEKNICHEERELVN